MCIWFMGAITSWNRTPEKGLANKKRGLHPQHLPRNMPKLFLLKFEITKFLGFMLKLEVGPRRLFG